MRPFSHINARSIDSALATLKDYRGKARLIAGGTDLLGVLKDEFLPYYPEAIINIKTIADLEYIKEENGTVRIGALTRLSDISKSPLLRKDFEVLALAANSVASPQIRNAATIGGNLCQDVRCWYYRYPRQVGGPMDCLRKGKGPCLAVRGDNRYHAILGGRKCFAVCPSDTAVALAALDGLVVIAGPAGERKIAVTDFYTPLGNALETYEMVREIDIPEIVGQPRQVFLKFTLRRPIDFAVASVACVMTMKNGVCSEARIALGAVASEPVRARAAEKFLEGRKIDGTIAEAAARLAVEGAKPLSENAYKVEIVKTLVKRAIASTGSSEAIIE
jgi:xanthine dehydrogenase YagS FAD-binding subunit